MFTHAHALNRIKDICETAVGQSESSSGKGRRWAEEGRRCCRQGLLGPRQGSTDRSSFEYGRSRVKWLINNQPIIDFNGLTDHASGVDLPLYFSHRKSGHKFRSSQCPEGCGLTGKCPGHSLTQMFQDKYEESIKRRMNISALQMIFFL